MADADFETLVAELAASNAPITAVGVQGKVTLRQAIANIYWKLSSVLTLAGRPRSPNAGDDQFGHVLSMRAETLVNQAILTAIADRINDPSGPLIDVDKIRTDVIRSFSP